MPSALSASDERAVAEATALLDSGELVVIPGDVAYLVAADALDDSAVERLFTAKGRGADRALTVLIAGYEDLHHVAYGGPAVRELADEHWPGPVALTLRARPWLPDALTAGQQEVAVTVPRNAFARALAKHFGPIAIASARRSGAPLTLTAKDAQNALGAEVSLVVDAGALPGGAVRVIRGGTVAPE